MLSVVQGATDVAIAAEFVSRLRAGKIDGIPYNKVVGIGHSYGSIQVQAMTAIWPALFDAVILTGFSLDQYVALSSLMRLAAHLGHRAGMAFFFGGGAYTPAMEAAPDRYAGNNFPSAYIQNGLVCRSFSLK